MMLVGSLPLVFVLLWLTVVCFAQSAAPGPAAPRSLRCEYLTDPRGIDVAAPRLSWEVVDERRGAVQSAYRVLVAGEPAALAADEGDLWDSGRVPGDQSAHVAYEGQRLTPGQVAWWKVRTWDAAGAPSPWSAPATWSLGLRDARDWQAQWIADPVAPPPFEPARNGYHSQLAPTADDAKWVTIDLGKAQRIDAVRLHPARPIDWPDTPGFLFPLRLKVEVADTDDWAVPRTVVDQTADDVPSPRTNAVDYRFAPIAARYVRLTATRLRGRNPGEYGLALAELEVLAGERSVALGRPVTARDSIEVNHWSTRYLTDGVLTSRGALGQAPLPPPVLRRAFTLNRKSAVRRATCYVTALGLYELHLNGQRVGDHVLAPEWTDYHRRVQYQTYDVTDLVHGGENVIGVQLGDGWYCGRIGLSGIVPDGPSRRIYGDRPKLLLRLAIELADGSSQVIVSDGSWRSTAAGPIRVSDLLDGEAYDARCELPGWDAPGFDDASWSPVAAAPAPVTQGGPLASVAQPNEPIRVTRELPAIGLARPRPTVWVYDLGQNMVGRCRVELRAPAGTTVTLRHAEGLNPDGTIYTANLRSAAQTDQYVCRGAADGETFEPHFTYHGFRYVEVTGLPDAPRPEDLVGRVFHSAAPECGEFACANPQLNRLWQNIVWTQRANLMSVPTDCPQRDERLGWMGDILAFAQTACFNLDMAAFLTKWVPDVRDAQTADGRYPDFAPHPFDPSARCSSAPGWGDAGVFVPWCAYVNYADRRLLEEHYDSARRWVDYVQAQNPDLLWKHSRGNDYGDWLNADTLKLDGWPVTGAAVPKELFATAFFCRSTQLVAQMAGVLGRRDDARRYADLAGAIRAAFNREYVQPDGALTGDTQAGYALALAFDLLDPPQQDEALRRMIAAFDRYGGSISTGFHSTICLMNELTRRGRVDEAYRLLLNRTMPSWLYPVDHGATTVWERWDGYVAGRGFQDPGMNSLAHYAYGSVGEWMFRTSIGLNPDAVQPGYKHFTLRPRPGGGLSWAQGAYRSLYGRIACAWRVVDQRLTIDVTIPANTTATVYVPVADPEQVQEGGRPAGAAEGVRFLRAEDGAAVYAVAAGRYTFSAPRAD